MTAKIIPTKACPIILRWNNGLEILAFKHPLAGIQLVKGTIELNETPEETAIRELTEEAGIVNAKIIANLGIWQSSYQNQIWSFYLCEVVTNLPDKWIHYTHDDGGHDFEFFWHPLHQSLSSEWHLLFQDAIIYVRSALNSSGLSSHELSFKYC